VTEHIMTTEYRAVAFAAMRSTTCHGYIPLAGLRRRRQRNLLYLPQLGGFESSRSFLVRSVALVSRYRTHVLLWARVDGRVAGRYGGALAHKIVRISQKHSTLLSLGCGTSIQRCAFALSGATRLRSARRPNCELRYSASSPANQRERCFATCPEKGVFLLLV
jgi:hypothetical protein